MSLLDQLENRLDGCCAQRDANPGLRAFVPLHATHQLVQAIGEVHAPLVTLLCVVAVAVSWRRQRTAAWLLFVAGVLSCISRFPDTANHVYLGALASLLLALTDSSAEGQRLTRAHLVALPLAALFWGGLTKVLHGQWFHGQALATLFVARADVQAALVTVLPSHEVARLSTLRFDEGQGPFVLGPVASLVGNAVWLIELALPASVLFLRQASTSAWWLLLLLALGIQVVAHEWVFALLLVNLVALTAPHGVAALVRRLTFVGLLLLALVQGGVVTAPVWSMPTTFRVRSLP